MKNALNNFALSMVGLVVVGGLWTFLSLNVAPDLPSPLKTWQESKLYILSPWEKRGEMESCLMQEEPGAEVDSHTRRA